MTNENYLGYMQKNYEYSSKNIEENYKKDKRSALSESVSDGHTLIIEKLLKIRGWVDYSYF